MSGDVRGLHGRRAVARPEDALSLITEVLARGTDVRIVVHVSEAAPLEHDPENRHYQDWVFGEHWSPRDLAIAGLRIQGWALDCFPKDGE